MEEFKISWQSPSNIAIVKYWGKEENQIPMNPSFSFTLDKSKSITTLIEKPKNQDSENKQHTKPTIGFVLPLNCA